jgi:carboxymethylenebutenolidase
MSANTSPLPPLPPLSPLPTPFLQEPLPGVSLLQPLSRRGQGPGLVILLPDLNSPILTIQNGIPSPLVKWAEEGYVVAAINVSRLQRTDQAKGVLLEVIRLLNDHPMCDLKERIGLVGKSAR